MNQDVDVVEAVDRWTRLWAMVSPDQHPVGSETLGEYAVLVHRDGWEQASRILPAGASHLAAGCRRCQADLDECLAFVSEEEQAAVRSTAKAARRANRDIPTSRHTRIVAGVADTFLSAPLDLESIL